VGPAQWPDSNRYMESLIVKLCNANPFNQTTKGKTVLRWTLVGRAYQTITEVVRRNARVMETTNIQLLDINNTTLTQWFNRRAKLDERQQLEQGLQLPSPPLTASDPLPPAKALSPVQVPPQAVPHEFSLPQNTTGQSQKVRRRLPPPSATPANVSAKRVLISTTPANIETDSYISEPVNVQSAYIPRSTLSYRKKKSQQEQAGLVVKRNVKRRTTDTFTCHQCGKERTSEYHTQYYGSWFCGVTSDIPLADWKAERVRQRQEKKQKASQNT